MMQASLNGDAGAYRELLESLSKFLRIVSNRLCNKYGMALSESEDVVQEVLLIVHLKRRTWDPSRPIGPWITAYYAKQACRCASSSRPVHQDSYDDIIDVPEVEGTDPVVETHNVERILSSLKDTPQKMSQIDRYWKGLSIQQTATRFAYDRSCGSCCIS